MGTRYGPMEPTRYCYIRHTTANEWTLWQITDSQYFHRHNVIVNEKSRKGRSIVCSNEPTYDMPLHDVTASSDCLPTLRRTFTLLTQRCHFLSKNWRTNADKCQRYHRTVIHSTYLLRAKLHRTALETWDVVTFAFYCSALNFNWKLLAFQLWADLDTK